MAGGTTPTATGHPRRTLLGGRPMNLDGLLLAFAIAAALRFGAWLAFRRTSAPAGGSRTGVARLGGKSGHTTHSTTSRSGATPRSRGGRDALRHQERRANPMSTTNSNSEQWRVVPSHPEYEVSDRGRSEALPLAHPYRNTSNPSVATRA